MAPPNPVWLTQAAEQLRGQVAAINRALSAYDHARHRLVWTGPGRDHLEAYHAPSRRRLEQIRANLERAARDLDRAAEDLRGRLNQLRVDEQAVRANLHRYFDKLNYDPAEIARYRSGLPASGDPAWAEYARRVVGHSATGSRVGTG